MVIAYVGKSKSRHHKWLCKCDCGNEHIVYDTGLSSGNVRSCGCFQKESASKRHRVYNTPEEGLKSAEYRAWRDIKSRCFNPNTKGYKNYGGRGITMCTEWANSFSTFVADVGRRPSSSMSIDRINNNGDYEPGNVRWATRKAQLRNTRRNKLIMFNGEIKCLVEWAEHLHLPYRIIMNRFNRGWSVDKALQTPVE